MLQVITDLTAVFHTLHELYAKLLGVSEQKCEYIKKGDTDGVLKILKEESALINAIGDIEKARIAAVDKFCITLGFQADNITLETILKYCNDKQKSELRALSAKLTDIAEKQIIVNQINKNLIMDNLQYIDFMLNTISGATVITNSYDKTGRDANSERIHRAGIELEM